ncbi:unnamed protein product [Ectocarpus sp. 8 AP-2014]
MFHRSWCTMYCTVLAMLLSITAVVVFVLRVGDVLASDRVGARGMRVCSRRDKKDNCVLEARRRPREVTLSPSDEDLHDVI